MHAKKKKEKKRNLLANKKLIKVDFCTIDAGHRLKMIILWFRCISAYSKEQTQDIQFILIREQQLIYLSSGLLKT